MNLVPVAAAALATGILVRLPLAAAPLLLLSLAAPRLRPLRVPALAFLAGALLPSTPPPSPLLAAFPEGAGLVRVEGTVARGPDLPYQGTSDLTLSVERVGDHPLRGRILVFLPEGAPLPSPGARVTATGRLERPRRAGNPGEAGARRALRSRGVSHLLRVRAPGSLRVDRPAPPLSPRAAVHRARLAVDGALSSLSRPETAAFLSCLLLGRRDRVPEELVGAFRRSGTSHFLAISGLHVGILAGLVWAVLRAAPVPRPAAALGVAGVALAYAAVTGLRPPALRAALLVLLLAGGAAARRKPRPLHLLALAAILILVADPGSLDRVGFQLSFTAVLAILHLSRRFEDGLFARWKLLDRFSVPRERRLRRLLRRYVTRSVPVSVAAWLGTAPLLLTRFGTLSLLVVPANLLVFPFVALLIPAGLLAAATGVALPADLLTAGLAALVRGLGSLPLAAPTLPPPPLSAVVAFYAGLLLLGRLPRLGWTPLAACLLGLGLLAASGALLRNPPGEPRLTVLSVGPGLCAVLETPEGGVLLYDVGSRRPRVFARVVLPWLRWRRIAAVDALVLSHGDADHTNGAGPLLRALPVGRRDPPGDLEAGGVLSLPGARVEVLWPSAGTVLAGNDASAVLRVRAAGLSVLLAGDLEEEGIRELLATGRDLSADVLLLPHHGRPTPAAADLLAAVGARVLVASDAPGDPFDRAYAGALRTSERGAVTVRPGPRVETFR